MTEKACKEEEKKVAVRKNSLRGSVVLKWESSGKPVWDVKKTLAACIHVDNKLEDKGLEPAPQFRKKTRLDDQKYMRTWVLGCHFPWLNPR